MIRVRKLNNPHVQEVYWGTLRLGWFDDRYQAGRGRWYFEVDPEPTFTQWYPEVLEGIAVELRKLNKEKHSEVVWNGFWS